MAREDVVAAALTINPQRDRGAAVRVIVGVVPVTSCVAGSTALDELPSEVGIAGDGVVDGSERPHLRVGLGLEDCVEELPIVAFRVSRLLTPTERLRQRRPRQQPRLSTASA